jgi:acyl-CoA synthetase (AMP-forming)/AMP-acid ligase II
MDSLLPEPSGTEAIAAATTFGAFIRATAAAYGTAIAIRFTGETLPNAEISFNDLNERSAELARGLLARSVGKGSRIGFICGNGPEFALNLTAIARIGAVAIPLSTFIKAEELVRVLRQSDVHGLIVQRNLLGHDYVARLRAALPELRDAQGPALRIARVPFLRWIASTGEDLPPSIHGPDFLTGATPEISHTLLQEVEAEVHPSDQMIEIYTSGSMALPKGVKHLHGPVLYRVRYLAGKLGLSAGQEISVPLPMFWVGGLGLFLLTNWAAGATSLCTEGTSTSSKFAMGSVLAAEDMAMLRQTPPFWALGMSETFGPYAWGDVLRLTEYPLCAPLDHIAERFDLRVADESGQPVGEGETGEIQVRGYALAPALHKLERAEYYTPDGYFRTGDLGLVDGARVHFLGRDGDMIKTAGSNVSPAEVELELQAMAGVHSAYVVGLPDKARGQLVVAAVIARPGAVLDFAAIEASLRQRLSSYKVPRAYIAITRDEVPMLPSNKVARRQLAVMLADRLSCNSAI